MVLLKLMRLQATDTTQNDNNGMMHDVVDVTAAAEQLTMRMRSSILLVMHDAARDGCAGAERARRFYCEG